MIQVKNFGGDHERGMTMDIDKSIRKALNIKPKRDMFSKQFWFAASTRIPRLPQRQPQPFISQKPISQPPPFVRQKTVREHLNEEANETFEKIFAPRLTEQGKQYVNEYKKQYGRMPIIYHKGDMIDNDKVLDVKPGELTSPLQRTDIQQRGPMNLKLSQPLNREETGRLKAFNRGKPYDKEEKTDYYEQYEVLHGRPSTGSFFGDVDREFKEAGIQFPKGRTIIK